MDQSTWAGTRQVHMGKKLNVLKKRAERGRPTGGGSTAETESLLEKLPLQPKGYGSKKDDARRLVRGWSMNALGKLAGGDEDAALLLSDLCKRVKSPDPSASCSNHMCTCPVVGRIAEAYRNTPEHEHSTRAQLVQFVHDAPLDQLTGSGPKWKDRGLGFVGLGHKLWRRVSDSVKRWGYLPWVPVPTGTGEEAFSEEKVDEIHAAWREYCVPATAALDVSGEECWCLEFCPSYVAAKLAERGICGVTSALKYQPANVCNPRRATDLCRHCEGLRKREAQQKRQTRHLSTKYPGRVHPLDTCAVLIGKDSPLTTAEKTSVFRLALDICELQVHREVKNAQNAKFKEDVAAAKKKGNGRGVLLLDYKANVKTGRRKREQDNAYYAYSAASILGVVVWLPGMEQPVYYDSVSGNMAHSAAVADTVVRNVLSHAQNAYPEAFGSLKDLRVWSDCGSHFRCGSFLYTCLRGLVKQFRLDVVVNFFCEYHGKSQCDQHFAAVQVWLRQASLSGKGEVLDPGDVVAALKTGHACTAERCKATRKPHAPLVVLTHGEPAANAGRFALELPKGLLREAYAFAVKRATPTVVQARALSCVEAGRKFPLTAVRIVVGSSGEVCGEDGTDEASEELSVGKEAYADEGTQVARWARDVLPEPTSKFQKLRKKHAAMRASLEEFAKGTPGLSDTIELLAGDTVASMLKDFSEMLTAVRVVLPAKYTDAREELRGMVQEEGRAAVVFSEDSGCFTLVTLNGVSEEDDTCVEAIVHNPTGPELCFWPLKDLLSKGCPMKGRTPTLHLLNVNFYDAATPPPAFIPHLEQAELDKLPDIQLVAGVEVPVTWALCSACRRWRLVPPVVYKAARGRGQKFSCASVHPRGCREPMKAGEVKASDADDQA